MRVLQYRVGAAAIAQAQSFRVVDPQGEFHSMTSWPAEARSFGSQVARGHLLAMIPDPVTEETVPTVYAIRAAVEGLD